MPAGKHSSSEITVSYKDAPGGTLRVVTSYILTMSAIKITSNMENATAMGDAWEKSLPSGIRKMDDITLTGFWDDTATTGPHVVFLSPDWDPQGVTRTLTIVFGNAKTFSVETYLMSYEVLGKAGNLTQFVAVINPTSTGTWS